MAGPEAPALKELFDATRFRHIAEEVAAIQFRTFSDPPRRTHSNATLAPELGLQDLRTRITKRITRVAPGASSPDVHLTPCRVLLSLSGQHAADTRTRQRVFLESNFTYTSRDPLTKRKKSYA